MHAIITWWKISIPVCVVGGGLPVVQKQTSAQKKPLWQQDKIAHNPLDSTSPLVKKGKQREVPKAKKPTPLKKAKFIYLLCNKDKYNQFYENSFQLCSSVYRLELMFWFLRSFWRRERRGSRGVYWRREDCCLKASINLRVTVQKKSSVMQTPQVRACSEIIAASMLCSELLETNDCS